jgi:hypothetical protein
MGHNEKFYNGSGRRRWYSLTIFITISLTQYKS